MVFGNARAGRGGGLPAEVEQVLTGHGIDWRHESPADPSALCAAIETAAPRVDAVVIAGGDGSVHAALPGLLASGVPTGILPLGTANDLARTLGLPTDLAAAAEVIATGRVRRLDVGTADDHPFCNVAHIGFGVRAQVHGMQSGHKRVWRSLSYPLSLIRAARLISPFRVTVTVDDERTVLRIVHLSVGNGRFYGGGIPVEADAAIDDGQLDAYAIPPQRLAGLFTAIRDVRLGGGVPGSAVWRDSGSCIHVHTRRAHRVLADGELIGHTPVTFRVCPRALPVIVPEDGPAPGLD